MEKPFRQVTILFLLKDNSILLAMKKRGFGQGRWNGVGGKLNLGESVEAAAIRETQEEINVEPKKIDKVAVIDFYFPPGTPKEDFNQQAHVYFLL
jgi:ADP-ribose pyrophosphatase YjhB (NUDIX family)